MKLKTKLLAPLFVVLMLGMATSAFAQQACTVTTTPAGRDINNGHWENTGDLVFSCGVVGAVPTTDVSVTVYYAGFTITNTTALPTDHIIQIAPGATLAASLDTTRTDTGTASVSNTGSLVALTIPTQAAGAPGGTFTLRNVLLSLANNSTVGSPINANINFLSASGNTTLTGSPIQIVSNVLPMLNSTTNPPALQAVISGEAVGPAQFTTAGAPLPPSISCNTANCQNNRSAFSMTVSEDHPDSFRTPNQFYNNGVGVSGTGATNAAAAGTSVLFTFSGLLQGAIVSNCVLIPPAGTTWNLTGSGIANTLVGTSYQTTFVAELVSGTVTNGALPTGTNLSAIETLTVNCGTSTTNPAYLVGASSGAATTPVTVTMSAFPQGTALSGTNGPQLTGGTPRYQAGTTVGPLTVIQFGQAAVGQTTMLIPYAVSGLGNFDTGIAIANTTKDGVFGTNAQGAAPDTAGTISFNFYPGDSTVASFQITTPSIPSGGSYINTLSNILKLASPAVSSFQGYIIAVANFTHAHGVGYVYGGTPTERLTSSTPVLVITNPLIPPGTGRNGFGPLSGVEQTAQ